ncbi:hypothetical protein [Streptomyces sp. NPDC002640]
MKLGELPVVKGAPGRPRARRLLLARRENELLSAVVPRVRGGCSILDYAAREG